MDLGFNATDCLMYLQPVKWPSKTMSFKFVFIRLLRGGVLALPPEFVQPIWSWNWGGCLQRSNCVSLSKIDTRIRLLELHCKSRSQLLVVFHVLTSGSCIHNIQYLYQQQQYNIKIWYLYPKQKEVVLYSMVCINSCIQKQKGCIYYV